MGVTRSEEDFDRAKATVEAHIARIEAAGGVFQYCAAYLKHLTALSNDGEPAILRERAATFPRMAVQIAAVSAIKDAREAPLDALTMTRVKEFARAAWIQSAGHYDDSSAENAEVVSHPNPQAMEMIRKGASVRRAKAAEQWDRLVDGKLDNLYALATVGREFQEPPSRKERWTAYIILAGLLVAIAAYVGSNHFLSVKISSPYESDEGFQQHRDATARVTRHSDLMSSTARRAGLFKLILDWPMSPTENEIAAFTKFGSDVIRLRRQMIAAELICGSPVLGNEGMLAVIKTVNNEIDIKNQPLDGFNRPQSMIIQALARSYAPPCS